MTLEPLALEIAYASQQQADGEACGRLWRAVIKQAARDIRWIRCYDGRSAKRPNDRPEALQIMRYPPAAFVDDQWFDEVCGYIEIDAGKMRSGFNELIEGLA